jgi:hypothetical protein
VGESDRENGRRCRQEGRGRATEREEREKKEKGRKGAKRPGVKPEREKKNPVWGDGEVQRERTEMRGIK